VKVCGLTRAEDVEVAVEAGADLCGFVLEPASPRAAREVLQVPETALSVAVFVGEPGEAAADLVQLYEREDRKVRGRDAVFLRDGEQVATVVDLPWEEEDETQLERARAVEGRLVLAGGLGPHNVRRAIAATRPWAVDASSSLEASPGVKDHELVRAYVAAAR
jgi:phosphoribosylanthranilate isomerase